MAKLPMTEKIERELFKFFFIKKSMRCGLEVNCPKKNIRSSDRRGKDVYDWDGRCDFIAYHGDIFTFIEIKVSVSDFKSNNGHNLLGHKNYYAVPEDIADKIKPLLPKHIGLYVLTKNGLSCWKNAQTVTPLFEKAPKYYNETVIEMLKHKILTACNTRLYNAFRMER